MKEVQATVHEANQFRQTGKMPESLKKRVQQAKAAEKEKEKAEAPDKPNASATKAELQAYLDAEGIDYADDATNKELYSLIE